MRARPDDSRIWNRARIGAALSVVWWAAACGTTGRAGELKPVALFADHMVLQRDVPLPVWGRATPGAEVNVELNGQRGSAKVGADRRWRVTLPAMKAGGPFELVISGSERLTFKDVWIGEVWLASGQSNMEMPINWGAFGKPGSEGFKQNMKEADQPALRMFFVKRTIAGEPQDDVTGSWKVAAAQDIQKWSAVGYFFAQEIRKKYGVTVGILNSSVGGTPVESWLSRAALTEVRPDLADSLKWWDGGIAKYLKDQAAGKTVPTKAKPQNNPDNPWWPSSLYRGMIHPLAPYALRGAIWYQGESNASSASTYAKTFQALIGNWRKDWDAEFPFLFVHLAGYEAVQTQPVEPNGWVEVREAQRQMLALPKTALASAVDVGDVKNVHPWNKQEVARRLFKAAEVVAYGEAGVPMGPLYAKHEIREGAVVLHFAHAAGLKAQGDELKGFAVAGEDQVWHWGTASIEGETVVVASKEVPKPLAVRYSWAKHPIGNLWNAAGLPAAPFRTDDWPLEKKK